MVKETQKKSNAYHYANYSQKKSTQSSAARIEYQGKMASVRSIGAGRVLLDFNPPLAGRTLIYDVTVAKKLDASEEKISAIIHRRVPVVEEDKFKIAIQDKEPNHRHARRHILR